MRGGGLLIGLPFITYIHLRGWILEREVRGHIHMTSALRGREGVGKFLTKEREVAWIWY